MRTLIIAIALCVLSGTAVAQQSPPNFFERGVELYKQGKYKEASEMFKLGYEVSPKPDVLFAWAQSERMANNCAKALELFDNLLEQDLPEANRKAVETNIEKCKAQMADAEQAPTLDTPAEPDPPPAADPPQESPAAAELSTQQPSPEPRDDSWYKDPVGASLLAGGAIATGVGIGLLVSAASADSDKNDADNYFDFEEARDRAESRGRTGMILSGVGVLAIGAGITWYLVRDTDDDTALSAWTTGKTTGVAVVGHF